MCGIFCCLPKIVINTNACKDQFSSLQCSYCLENKLHSLLRNRGPNSERILFLSNIGLTFAGFVLWHQGQGLCQQPVEIDHSNVILLFNGDIFNYRKCHKISDVKKGIKRVDLDCYNQQNQSECLGSTVSDTNWLGLQLKEALLSMEFEDDVNSEILELFRQVEGPYSCIFYSERWKSLYFLRDSLGRNSLLIEHNMELEHFHILSTAVNAGKCQNKVVELPPFGLYRISLSDPKNWSLIPWQTPDVEILSQIDELSECLQVKINCQTTLSIAPKWLTMNPKYEVLYFNFYELCASLSYDTTEELYNFLLKHDLVKKTVEHLSLLLENAVQNRVEITKRLCQKCVQESIECVHSKVAILFSGGLDCSILAYLCDKYIPSTDSIDLINVAFENSKSQSWDVPDRLTAKTSLQNLRKLSPTRVWNYVEVDVTRNELEEQLRDHLKHLIYPLNTVLDESIGSAFWFAARGQGYRDDGQSYTSPARVVIVGTGADELFGGYVRHRNAYNRCNGSDMEKYQRVAEEFDFDWQRLPRRNLARDDRVIGDTGRTSRTPFIEENLVQFIRSLPPQQRCCYSLPSGIGDKLLLRLYAHSVGLGSTSILPKRAIQFGSRIANKNQDAKDISRYLTHY